MYVSNGLKHTLIAQNGWRNFWNLYVSNGLKHTLIVHHGWSNVSMMKYHKDFSGNLHFATKGEDFQGFQGFLRFFQGRKNFPGTFQGKFQGSVLSRGFPGPDRIPGPVATLLVDNWTDRQTTRRPNRIRWPFQGALSLPILP